MLPRRLLADFDLGGRDDVDGRFRGDLFHLSAVERGGPQILAFAEHLARTPGGRCGGMRVAVVPQVKVFARLEQPSNRTRQSARYHGFFLTVVLDSTYKLANWKGFVKHIKKAHKKTDPDGVGIGRGCWGCFLEVIISV